MGWHGTGRHGPFSGEGWTDPQLDRTVVGHGTVHGHGPVQDGLDRPIHFKTLVPLSAENEILTLIFPIKKLGSLLFELALKLAHEPMHVR
jgi:hypothetical protein